MGPVSESAEGVWQNPPSPAPQSVRWENRFGGMGKPGFSQGKEDMEVKNILGILSKNGRFLSGKTSLK